MIKNSGTTIVYHSVKSRNKLHSQNLIRALQVQEASHSNPDAN